MAGWERVATARLVLTAPSESDLDELWALHADPAVWEHLPSGRHAERSRTVAQVGRDRASWAEHGLGSWVVRAGPDGAGPVLGLAGVRHHAGPAWNLGYRLARSAWGRGYASEVVALARAAAADVDPDLPVVAYLLEHNTGSRRTAERAGLTLRWRGPDAGKPDPGAVRLVFADRDLAPEVLAAFSSPP